MFLSSMCECEPVQYGCVCVSECLTVMEKRLENNPMLTKWRALIGREKDGITAARQKYRRQCSVETFCKTSSSQLSTCNKLTSYFQGEDGVLGCFELL